MVPNLPQPAPGYVASVDEVAVRLGVDPSTLTTAQRARIAAGLADAQGALESELNRPLLPSQVVACGIYPVPGEDMASWRAWRTHPWGDDVAVVSCVAAAGGGWDVTALVGIDARAIPDIRTWIVREAVAQVASDPASGMGQRAVKSVSAEGQSVTFESAPAPQGLTVEKLKRRWLRRGGGSRSVPHEAPWPYVGGVTIGTRV
ncbi:MAG TPA: hypothetical protein VFP72_08850 [Kineosporiaceae bacterium]|nr:hypothetical protein [Kineosporiaceae bacterium]